jgi:hypothetical protein
VLETIGVIAMALAIIVLGLGIAIAIGLKLSREQHEQDETWKRFARERGGRFRPQTGVKGAGGPFIDLRDLDPPVQVEAAWIEYGTSRGGNANVRHTEVSAKYAKGRVPRFRVRPKKVFRRHVESDDLREVVLGTIPKFDEHFLVKSEAGGSLGAVWDAEAQRMLLRISDAWVLCDGETVRVRWSGRGLNFERLDLAIALAGRLAGGVTDTVEASA